MTYSDPGHLSNGVPPRGASSGGAGAQLAPPGPRWRRIGYRVLVLPLFALILYVLIAGLAWSAWALVWMIRHV